MTIEKLLEKAREFEEKNKSFTWKPHDFPEDMTEESTLDELISETILAMRSCEEEYEKY